MEISIRVKRFISDHDKVSDLIKMNIDSYLKPNELIYPPHLLTKFDHDQNLSFAAKLLGLKLPDYSKEIKIIAN